MEQKLADVLGHPLKGTAACCLNLFFWRYISYSFKPSNLLCGLILLVHLANPLLPAHSFKPANPLQPITPSSQQICHRQFIPLGPVHPPRLNISLSPAIHPMLQLHILFAPTFTQVPIVFKQIRHYPHTDTHLFMSSQSSGGLTKHSVLCSGEFQQI